MTNATPQRSNRHATPHLHPRGAAGQAADRDPRTVAFVVALVAASPIDPRNAVIAFARRLAATRLLRAWNEG